MLCPTNREVRLSNFSLIKGRARYGIQNDNINPKFRIGELVLGPDGTRLLVADIVVNYHPLTGGFLEMSYKCKTADGFDIPTLFPEHLLKEDKPMVQKLPIVEGVPAP